jgi:capsule polysaccharide export protein KpsE/RkpR
MSTDTEAELRALRTRLDEQAAVIATMLSRIEALETSLAQSAQRMSVFLGR